jgi:hypothetical protein
MKKYLLTPVLVLMMIAGTNCRAQGQEGESLGLPGDNLNLYAVMKLFQESETLESFEKILNDENSRINNLDLNGDGQVDYIRVIDNVDGNVHTIVLQVAINVRENQDVAVFTVWRESDDRVQIQLTGDESLYGRNYIIEPIFEEGDRGETPNPGYTGNTQTINGRTVVVNRTTTVEISMWPLVRFLFLPTYVVWHSPWYYSYYPSYWRPWRPYYWDYYYGYHYHNYSYYYGHYRQWNDHRYPHWHDSYYSRRTYSPVVYGRIHEGYYKQTYSHPEQRREGTATYYRTHPNQNYNSDRRTSSSQVRRTSSPSGSTGRQTTTSREPRRSTSTGAGQRSPNAGTDRRTGNSAIDRKATSPATQRKSTSTATERKATSTPIERKSTSAEPGRRSTSAGSGNSGSKPHTEQQKARTQSNTQSGSGRSEKATRSTGNEKKSDSGNKSSGKRGESRSKK